MGIKTINKAIDILCFSAGIVSAVLLYAVPITNAMFLLTGVEPPFDEQARQVVKWSLMIGSILEIMIGVSMGVLCWIRHQRTKHLPKVPMYFQEDMLELEDIQKDVEKRVEKLLGALDELEVK